MEQPDYDNDRDEVIDLCKQTLKAIITCGPEPSDYGITLEMAEQHKGFVFPILGIHPQYSSKFDEEIIEFALQTIREKKDKIVGIGETGLDYGYIKDFNEREKQRQLFAKFIRLAKEVDLPILVHLRNGEDRETQSVFDHSFEIMEREGAERVQLHMFGSRQHVERAIKNGWYISMNAICLRSKSYSKVVRDTPMDRLLLETDCPWLHPSFDKEKRNDPTRVKEVAKRIAEIKKTELSEVTGQTNKNAIEFFRLPL
jgi:TatD DNase family protein